MTDAKHTAIATPRPWSVTYYGDRGYVITGNIPEDHVVVQRGDWKHAADGELIVACVNALAGVADPAARVARWKAAESLANDFPELNLNNYTHDDVAALNAWGIAITTALAAEGGGR